MYWYPTELVQHWLDGDATDHGSGLKAENESVEQAWGIGDRVAGTSPTATSRCEPVDFLG
jgi:hypothetical protein